MDSEHGKRTIHRGPQSWRMRDKDAMRDEPIEEVIRQGDTFTAVPDEGGHVYTYVADSGPRTDGTVLARKVGEVAQVSVPLITISTVHRQGLNAPENPSE